MPDNEAMKLGFVTEQEFDRVVDPAEMVKPYVATAVDLAKTSVREQVR